MRSRTYEKEHLHLEPWYPKRCGPKGKRRNLKVKLGSSRDGRLPIRKEYNIYIRVGVVEKESQAEEFKRQTLTAVYNLENPVCSSSIKVDFTSQERTTHRGWIKSLLCISDSSSFFLFCFAFFVIVWYVAFHRLYL